MIYTKNKSVTLILKPSHRCNFNCTYCYDRMERSARLGQMDKDKLIQVVDDFGRRYKKVTVLWHGGEPLLNGKDYVRDVMEYFVDKDYDLDWRLQTNASLIDEEWVEIFQKYNVSLGVSWDGVLQDQTRKHIDMEKTMQLLFDHNIHPGIIMVVTPENAFTMSMSLEFMRKYATGIDFNIIFGEDISDEQYSKVADEYLKLFDIMIRQEDVIVSRPFNMVLKFLSGNKVDLCDNMWCVGHWFSIEPNGDITPCGRSWDHKYIYGNFFAPDFTFESMFESEGMKLLWEVKQKNFEKCKNCKWLLCCQNGCPNNSFGNNGEILPNPDWYCHFRQKLIPGIIDLLDYHYEKGDLVNRDILNYLTTSSKPELKKWKNYKSHTTTM